MFSMPLAIHNSLNYLENILKDAKLRYGVSVIFYESFDVHYFNPAHSTGAIKIWFLSDWQVHRRFIQLFIQNECHFIAHFFLICSSLFRMIKKKCSRRNIKNTIMSWVNYFLQCKNFSTKIKIRNFLRKEHPNSNERWTMNDERT